MRLRSDIYVAALIRRAMSAGAFAALRRRGAPEAGAIFVVVDRRGGAALYAPAPLGDDPARGVERVFARAHAAEVLEPGDVEARLTREIGFDPDIWIVEIEDKEGRPFVDLA